jgi:hypothetical protein
MPYLSTSLKEKYESKMGTPSHNFFSLQEKWTAKEAAATIKKIFKISLIFSMS